MFGAIVSVFNIEVTCGFQRTIYQAELTGCREDVDYENRGIKFHAFGAKVSSLSQQCKQGSSLAGSRNSTILTKGVFLSMFS